MSSKFTYALVAGSKSISPSHIALSELSPVELEKNHFLLKVLRSGFPLLFTLLFRWGRWRKILWFLVLA
jgi:hypothetical protein